MRVAIIAMGEMGAGIGARLTSRGAAVVTSLAGRSAASAARAAKASIMTADDDRALLDGADIMLSILPPAEAGALARRLAPALAARGGRTVFADCNAIAPQTMGEVAAILASTGAPVADVGIVGGPPRGDDAGPRLYASGEAAEPLMALVPFGLDVRPVAGGIGAASALKMSYASLTKGLTSLGMMLSQGASRHGVAEALRQEFEHSQPMLLQWLMRQLPAMYPKAYRWDGEMREIARFLSPAPGAPNPHAPDPRAPELGTAAFEGIAAAYRTFADAWSAHAEDAPEVAAIEAVFHQAGAPAGG